LKHYLPSFQGTFFSCLDSDNLTFINLVNSYSESLFFKGDSLDLVNLVYDGFIMTCNWKNEKSLGFFL